MAEKMKKRIVVGATGASGLPLLIKCLEIIRENPEYESGLIMSPSAELTLKQETTWTPEEVKKLADHVFNPEEIGAKPASGSFKAEGMLIVPCSMKTIAGIHSGQFDLTRGRCDDQGTENPGAGRQGNAFKRDTSSEPLRTVHASGGTDHSTDDDLLS